MIYQIIEELNLENGSNYKKEVLAKYADNELLQRVLKMAYDKVSFTYGITMKNVNYTPLNEENYESNFSLNDALDDLEFKLCTREITGNEAIKFLSFTLSELSPEDAKVLEMIINRDLRINLGKTHINKVFKNLIVKPPYTRCEIGTDSNIKKNINFSQKVYSQVKMDGTFRRSVIDGSVIEISSRPGETQPFPIIEAEIKAMEIDGYVLIGEMTLNGEKDRKKGNGLINSDNPPHEDIIYTVWDMVPISEYSMSKDEIKTAEKSNTLSLYEDRLEMLENVLNKSSAINIQIIEYKIIKSMREAYEHFQEVTKDGGEGTVIKAYNMTHKDGNSKKQLKVKLDIDLDVICTGFTDGKKGTRRESTFGAMTFENTEGTIKGQTSGFTDEMLADFNSRRDELIGKVFTVRCNDITKSKSNDFHALSHPRFQEFRTKIETDSLERALELKEMAMSFS